MIVVALPCAKVKVLEEELLVQLLINNPRDGEEFRRLPGDGIDAAAWWSSRRRRLVGRLLR
jgi:hypothetical protein